MNKDTFTCANIIPLRISTDQPPLIAQRLELYYVSKTSPWAAHAGELFETAIPHVKTVRGMVRRLIERITVYEDHLDFEFKSGLETEVQM